MTTNFAHKKDFIHHNLITITLLTHSAIVLQKLEINLHYIIEQSYVYMLFGISSIVVKPCHWGYA